MKNNQYTATPNWFDKVLQTDDSVSTGNTYVTNFSSILLLSGLTDLVIEITGEEDGNGLSPEVSWNKEESKLSFVKTKFLKEGDPVVDADYVTTIADNPQDVLSNKDFINGLSINKHRFFEKDGILYLDGNLALTGGLVIYADNPEGGGDPGPGFGGGTILDISITGEGNVLSDVSLSEDKTILQFVKTNLDFSGNYVDFTSDQDISGVKNFTNGIKINGSRIYKDNDVIYVDGDLAVTGGITTFATAGKNISTIMDGIVADEVTITVAEKDGIKQLLLKEGVGGGLTSAIITGTGNAVTDVALEDEGKTLNLIKDKTFLIPGDLLGYAKEDWVTNQLLNYVTLNTEQDITAIKNFLEGVTIGSSKKKFYEKDGVLYIDSDVAFTGGITTFATDNVSVTTIMDGVAVDDITISKEGNVLKIKNAGTGSSFDEEAMWEALLDDTNELINISHLTTALSSYVKTESFNSLKTEVDKKWTLDNEKITNWDDAYDKRHTHSNKTVLDGITEVKVTNWDTAFSWGNHTTFGYAHLAGEETFTGLKHFTANITLGTNKKSIYEKDGVVYIDANLAVTGGITQYAVDPANVSDLMDNILTDDTTIRVNPDTKELEVIGGIGIDLSAMWDALSASTSEQINRSHLTTALQGYATESWVSSNFLGKTDKAVDSDKVDGEHNGNLTSRYLNPTSPVDDLNNYRYNGFTAWSTVSVNRPYEYGTLFQFSNMGTPIAGTNNHWVNQIAFGTNNRIYARQRINTGVWSSWSNIAYLSDTIPQAENSNKLQNLTWSDFFSRRYYYLDYGAQSTSNFYPIFFFPNDIELDCEIHSDNVSSADAYNQNRIHFQLTAQGWSDTGVSFRILSRNNYSDSEITIGAIGYGAKDGGIAIWVRGGKRYRLYCNKTPNMKTSDFTYGSNGEKYTVGTNLDGGANSSVNIIWKNDSNRNNGLVATVDGNVYSATKLQNTRTIWGRPFNGEQNVNGDLREVNNIYTNRGTIDAFTFAYNPSDSHDGLPWYGMTCYGNNEIGISGYGGINFFTSAGSILSLSPNGRTYANSVVTNDWFRSEGNTGWYSENWGGGWYMSDNVWIRAYNNKSIITGGGIQTAGNIEINGSGVFATNNNIILRKNGYTHTDVLSWNCDNTYGDHLTFNIPGTNDQSKFMKLSAHLGLVIKGGANIGDYIFYQNESTLSIYSDYNQNSPSEYGKETTCLQTSFDGQDPQTSSYPSQFPGRCVLSLLPRGGWVGIGLRNPTTVLDVNGNILSRGGITQYSDSRAKTIIEQIDLSLKDIANSPAIRFKWNGWKQKDDGKMHIGGIALYIQTILPEAIYNSDGAFTMDYATTGYIFAVNTAKHLLDYETKTDKEINNLKSRIKYLEKQLKKLGYEETNIMDN